LKKLKIFHAERDDNFRTCGVSLVGGFGLEVNTHKKKKIPPMAMMFPE
jgi:hypothetical protein